MSLVRKFIFFTDADVERFQVFMRANRKAMAEQKRFLQVTVAEHKANRTNEQNAAMWAGILEPMAQQVFLGGTRYKADIWNEQCKELYLPEVNAKGQEKWRFLPNGSRRLMMSTTDLNHDEMALYMHQVAAYAATDLGVLLPANPKDL